MVVEFSVSGITESLMLQVFRSSTPTDALSLIEKLLEYRPRARISPLSACAHKFFSELRQRDARLPSGHELPPLFNFTEQGEYLMQSTWLY